jgi:hypothetical protein
MPQHWQWLSVNATIWCEPMFAPTLNRDFVLTEIDVLSSYLKGLSRRGNMPTSSDPLRKELVDSLIAIPGNLENQQSYDNQPPSSFFAQDPLISNVQSALDEFWGFGTQRPIRPASAELRCVTDRTLPWFDPDRAHKQRLFNAFSVTDVGWVSVKVAEGIAAFSAKHRFVEAFPCTEVPNDDLRLILVGDWGTGLPRARAVGTAMRAFVEEGMARGIQQHVVHLGDVYYSGWHSEYEKRFLPYWPVKIEEANKVGSWCLNGNHDMYSGGYGYFDTLLSDCRFARQLGSSCFRLKNDHWDIIGLDTAWLDSKLNEFQMSELSTLANNRRRKVLLSHHQPFSVYERGSSQLLSQVTSIFRGCTAWFWGHEHRCMTFQPHAGIQFGRCIGHGGVPVYVLRGETEPCPSPGEWEYRKYLDGGLELWAKFGFAVLDFRATAIEVRYIDESGVLCNREEIVPGPTHS